MSADRSVLLYKDIITRDNDTVIFTNPSLEIHIHNCSVFNQIATKKAIELRDAGIRDPTLFDVAESDIVGRRVNKYICNTSFVMALYFLKIGDH